MNIVGRVLNTSKCLKTRFPKANTLEAKEVISQEPRKVSRLTTCKQSYQLMLADKRDCVHCVCVTKDKDGH